MYFDFVVQLIFKNKKLKTFFDNLFLKIIFYFDFIKIINYKFNLYNLN